MAAAGLRKDYGKKGNGRRRSISDSEVERQASGRGKLKCFNCRSTAHLCYTREGKWTCPEPKKDKKEDKKERKDDKSEKKDKQKVNVKKMTLSLFVAAGEADSSEESNFCLAFMVVGEEEETYEDKEEKMSKKEEVKLYEEEEEKLYVEEKDKVCKDKEAKMYEDCSVVVPTSSEEAVVLLVEECRGMGLFQ